MEVKMTSGKGILQYMAGCVCVGVYLWMMGAFTSNEVLSVVLYSSVYEDGYKDGNKANISVYCLSSSLVIMLFALKEFADELNSSKSDSIL